MQVWFEHVAAYRRRGRTMNRRTRGQGKAVQGMERVSCPDVEECQSRNLKRHF